MAVNWSGSFYAGDQNSSANYWTYTHPTFLGSAGGIWTLFFIHRVQHAIGGTAPLSSSSQFNSIWSNVVGETAGAGGSDCYLGFQSANNTTPGNRLCPQFRLSKSSVNILNSGSFLFGTTPYVRNAVYCTALVADGTNLTMFTAKKGDAAVQQVQALLNSSFTSVDKAIGTMRAAFGHFKSGLQAIGYCSGVAASSTDIANLALGDDPEGIFSAPNRTHLQQFTGPTNLTATWGAANATLVGSFSAAQFGSPLVPTVGTTFLSCDEPFPLRCYSFNLGGNSSIVPLTGTYNGYTPAALEYQITDSTGAVTQAWSSVSSLTVGGGIWGGSIVINQGYGRIILLREASDHSKSWTGTHLINVGVTSATSGQSQCQRQEGLYPGISTSPPANVAFLTVNQGTGVAVTFANSTTGPENFRGTNLSLGAGWNEEANTWATLTSNAIPLQLIPGAVPGTSCAQWAASTKFPWTSTTATYTVGGTNDTITLPSSGNPCAADASYNNAVTFITIAGTRYSVTGYVGTTGVATISGHFSPALSGTVSFTASGACNLNTNTYVELWPNLKQSIVFSGTNHVNIRWLQGTASAGFTDAQIRAHLDILYAAISTDLGALGITYNFIMDPQDRDTGNNVMPVNETQHSWAISHADYGTKVFVGIQSHDMSTNAEYQCTATSYTNGTEGVTAGTLTFPLNTFSDVNVFTSLEVVTGGFTQTVAGTTVAGVFTLSGSHAFSPTLSGTIVVRLSSNTPHQDYYGAVLIGIRRGADLAYKHGLSQVNPYGADLVKATYPHGGDGSIQDLYFQPASNGDWSLRTPNGGTAPSVIEGIEVTENSFTGTLTQSSQKRVSGMHIRVVTTAPSNKANLKVRTWRVGGWPIAFANFAKKDDCLYDGNGLTVKAGSPVNPTYGTITVTEAPPLGPIQTAPRMGARGNSPRLGVKRR